MPKCALKSCGKKFEPKYSSLQKCCSIECSKEWAKIERGKKEKKEYLQKYRELRKTVRENDRKQRSRAARESCHYWVRERDKGKPCISCGRTDEGERHASHYFDSGQFSGLRYDENNIHASCSWCNTAKHGNKIGYRAGLVQRYGLPYVETLEAKKDQGRNKKWSSEELKEIELYYKEKIKSIKLL